MPADPGRSDRQDRRPRVPLGTHWPARAPRRPRRRWRRRHTLWTSMRADGITPAPRCECRSLRVPVKGFALGGSLPARKLAGSPFRPRPSGDRPAPLPVLTASGAGAEVWPRAPGPPGTGTVLAAGQPGDALPQRCARWNMPPLWLPSLMVVKAAPPGRGIERGRCGGRARSAQPRPLPSRRR